MASDGGAGEASFVTVNESDGRAREGEGEGGELGGNEGRGGFHRKKEGGELIERGRGGFRGHRWWKQRRLDVY